MDLRKVLKKFTKHQLLHDAWPVLNLVNDEEPDIQHSTKDEMIGYIVKCVKDADVNIKKLVVALELKCCQVQADRRQWYAVEIKNPKIYLKETTVPDKFAQKLSEYLNRSQLFCEVVSGFLNNTMWTAISAKQIKSQTRIYLLAYPELPVFLYSYLRPNYQEIIFRSLIQVFKGSHCQTYPMKSKNIDTLLLCISQKLTVDNVEKKLPIVRKKKPENDRVHSLPHNVINEDHYDDLEREVYLEETFGSFEQPVLPSLTYKISSNFFGFDDEKTNPIAVTSRVVFKGRNVMEGIKDFVREGISDIPLPEYLTDIVHYGTDKIEIKQKVMEES